MQVARDRDVRKGLDTRLRRRYAREPDTLIVHELGPRHGISRVDIAVINGSLHGYEIKSDADTLTRLPAQISTYNAVLDYSTLVVGVRLAEKAILRLPGWWGIIAVEVGSRGAMKFISIQRPLKNESIDPRALAELLWRSEAEALLAARGVSRKILNLPRAYLYQCLTEMFDIASLRRIVRNTIKNRGNWRGREQPLSYVDCSKPIPKL